MSFRFLVASAALIGFSLAVPTSAGQSCSVGFMNSTTGSAAKCPHSTSTFCQLVDHSRGSATNNTFLQQYQVITDFFKPGGPIFFIQGAETRLSCIEGYSAYEYARELGALLVANEHRYFGVSTPFGLNSSESAKWTVEDMRALTLDNILADSALLVQTVRETMPGAENSKVIAFGGSYPGFLVPILKHRYPDLFYGVIASGGVFTGLNTSPGPDAPVNNYANWVSNVVADLSFDAARTISSGFEEVRNLMQNGSFDVLKQSLNLCTTPKAVNQTSLLTDAIYETYASNSQFAEAPPVFGLPAHSLQYLINETLRATTPLVALNASIAMMLTFNANEPCLAWDSEDETPNEADIFGDSRQYDYMVCTFYPYPNGANSNDTIFGPVSELPDSPSVTNVNEQQCQRRFNISAKTGDEAYQKELGVSQQQLMNGERMFFVEAQYDWVSVMGLQSWAASGNRNKSRWWFMAEAGHTMDLVRASDFDPQPLKDTRIAELSYMKSWLGM